MKYSDILWQVPGSWAWAHIIELGDVVAGGTPSSKEPSYWGGNINWISPADLTGYTRKTILRGAKSLTESGLKNSSARVMPAGSIHFSSRAPIGYVVISAAPMSTNQGFKSLVPSPLVFNEYVYYYLKGAKQLAQKRASGTTFLELSGKAFGELPVPLPPLNEQRRIVAKIEALFSELDKGIEALKTAREQLKVYRQAVLKQAFEGKLTARWREENKGKLETPEQLLAHIQQERQARYQQQLKDWQDAIKAWEKNGKVGKKPGKPKIIKDLPPFSEEEINNLPLLPESWQWVKIDKICDHNQNSIKAGPFGSALKKEFYTKVGYKIYGQEQVISGNPYIGDYYIDQKKFNDLESCRVQPNDILISLVGTVGKVLILPVDSEDGIINPRLIKISPNTEFFDPRFFKFYFESAFVRSLYKTKTHGATMDVMNLSIIQELPFPLLSMNEQSEIVAALEAVDSEIEALDRQIDKELERSGTLRQSILKKSFAGQLVPQDQNDEPASVLLERIKAEKKELTPIQKRGSRKSTDQSLPSGNVIPMPHRISGISTTDLHAGILALAYSSHQEKQSFAKTFHHVKGEKISHMVEAHLAIDLDRNPIKDAAGPNDFPHLKKVESRAQKANWFLMKKDRASGAYNFKPGRNLENLQDKVKKALGERLALVESLLIKLRPLSMQQAEIVATLYAAWNNLLLLEKKPDDEEIVFEARENWHPAKLEIERWRFFKGLEWMRDHELIPTGSGKLVKARDKAKNPRKPKIVRK